MSSWEKSDDDDDEEEEEASQILYMLRARKRDTTDQILTTNRRKNKRGAGGVGIWAKQAHDTLLCRRVQHIYDVATMNGTGGQVNGTGTE